MTRIDFYVLDDSGVQAQNMLACRIANKAYDKQQHVYIHTNDQGQSDGLDQFMWAYQDGSFLPHCQHQAKESTDTPIVIGHDHEPDDKTDVLINLANTVPGFYSRFERVIELVTGDEPTREKARARFKYYRDRGYPIETHKLAG